MGRFKDLTGQRFGRLIVLQKADDLNNRIAWLCECDCGKRKVIVSTSLIQGGTKSCGCYNKERISECNGKNLTQKKFGRLTAIKIVGKSGRCNVWLCVCDCGKETKVATNHLMCGNTKSCGCYGRERTSEVSRKDLTGKRFGKLVAIENMGTNNRKQCIWKCKCDCGRESLVNCGNLNNGHIRSCGCQISYGNNKIDDILTSLNIKFEREKKFLGCENKTSLRFDFFIEPHCLAIEYQGEQHYKSVKYFGGDEKFEEIQLHDQIKRDYCRQNNIELLEISYKDYDRIEDILREKLNIPKDEIVISP